ncbi:hypothetical protein [Mesorhizobium denitrificans]|uniref:Uncharacterized protein n=1 Tax=Mesorhizobium denitrificans TaxID=2294114 RepID=A0A371X1W1_9HYPH|nr:hypothetical protein [Mesorhizobium denitrificans]RFC63216.1 hypothetical protein DY251_21105 [Mesorhizobium denitrificans]
MAGGAILGGLLGAGAGALFSRADLGRLSRMVEDAQQPGFDGATDVLHRELTDMAVGNRSVGAAAAPVDTLDDLSIAGGLAGKVAGATAQLNPMLRTLTSPSRVVRSVAASLMDTPVYLKKNLRGEGEIAAETAMQEWTRGAVAQAVEGQRLTYLEARKTGLRMSESEFRAEVGKAMRRGDKSEFPAVEKVAKEWRARVFEPLKKRAIAAGLLPEDVKVATAESYFSRVYNKEMITARESEFKDIVTRWAEKEIDRSALNSKRVLDAKTLDAQREINDLNMKVQRRETDLQERLQAGEISPDQFDENEVVQFARRVASGERPAMPQRLSEWLRKLQRDGIYDKNGDLAAAYPELRKIPGLLRKSRKGTQNTKGGLGLDDVVNRAWEEGFLNDAATATSDAFRDTVVERPTIRAFLDALDNDLRGGAVVRVADMEAARSVDDFDQVMRAMERSGIDFEKVRFATTEAMRGIAQAVNRSLADLDRAKIAKIDQGITEMNRRGDFDFVNEADRAAYVSEVVNNIFDMVTGKAGDAGPRIDLPVAKHGPLQDRTFMIPDVLIEQFLESDVQIIGQRYARLMAGDVELTDRFGSATLEGPIEEVMNDYSAMREKLIGDETIDAGERERQLKLLAARERADLRDLQGVRDLVRGEYRPDIQHTGFARILRAASAFNYMRALGGVAVANLTELVRPAMVHGMTAYMGQAIKPLLTNTAAIKLSVKEAKLAGAVTERILASRIATLAELTDPYSSASPIERFIENAAAGFSKMTGLLHLNDFNKSMASVLTQNRILQNAEKAVASGFDSLPAKERAYMGFLGLNEARTEAIGRLFAQHGETLENVRVANSEAWMDDGLRSAYRAAINKDVDSIIATKSAGDTPLFANTPLGRTLLQFRTFAIASNQRVLIRGLQEDKARFVGGLVGMISLGILAYMFKQIESGREISNNPGTLIAEGLDRSGIFSLGFEINNAIEKVGGPGAYGLAAAGGQALMPGADARQPASRFATRTAWGGFLGPTFDLGERTVGLASIGLRAINGNPDLTPGDIENIRRLAPFASLPYWRWMIDGMAVPAAKEAVK